MDPSWGRTAGLTEAYLVPLPLAVQRDDHQGWVDQIAFTVEGEVLVLPSHVQHVAERQTVGLSLAWLLSPGRTSLWARTGPEKRIWRMR